MKIQHVPVRPTEAALEAGRRALTPEMLAATFARYSRSDLGLDEILAKVELGNEREILERFLHLAHQGTDTHYPELMEKFVENAQKIARDYRPSEQDQGVDRIFQNVDYGHKSIGDMAPVPMALDGLTAWAVYWIWSQVRFGKGQETSTRYCRMDLAGLPAPEELGIRDGARWSGLMEESLAAYREAYDLWLGIFEKDPAVARIPSSLLLASDDKSRKTVERLKRNYAFDRARSFLPAAVKTNQTLVQTGMEWVFLVQQLLAHPLPEFGRIGVALREELELVVPRLTRHAVYKEYWAAHHADELEALVEDARTHPANAALNPTVPLDHLPRNARILRMEFFPHRAEGRRRPVERSLRNHQNRYAPVGSDLWRLLVRWYVGGVDLAAIRDMNRHQPGNRYAELIPSGFYWAEEELPAWATEQKARLRELAEVGKRVTRACLGLLLQGDPAYVYYTLLGTEFPWERASTGGQIIYEGELRTGTGAHYKYARIYRDLLNRFYQEYPTTQGLILEGSAEPE